MAELSKVVAGHIAQEKDRLETTMNGGPLAKLMGLLGQSSGTLVFEEPVTNDGVTVVPVSQAKGDSPIPIGYIEANGEGATFHKTTVSDIPEYLLFAALLILPIIAILLVVRGILALRNKGSMA